jgi:glutaconate CoA-transferase subunit A
MIDKRLSLQDAAALVPERNGRLSLGGITLYRRPLAMVLALIARKRETGFPQDLTLINFTSSIESDLLIGLQMVKAIRSCYTGLEAFGLAPFFTEAANQGEIEIIEETEASLALGIRASLSGVGFIPSYSWQGTDLLKLRPDVKTVSDPYSGETLTAFPAIECDVAFIHAMRADPSGNAYIGKNWGIDRELALLATTVIVTTEEIVDDIREAHVFAPRVAAVVEAPNGSWPTSCHPNYPLDGHAVLRYANSAATDAFPSLLSDWMDRHKI